MTKKQIADYVRSAGGTTAYSGKERVMYVTLPEARGMGLANELLSLQLNIQFKIALQS